MGLPPPPARAIDGAEARYRALFDTMGPAVLLMRGPACVDCNPATLALFGLERRDEMLGKTPLDFAPEVQPNGRASAELVQENVLLAVKNGSHTFEWHSRKKSGEPLVLEVRFTPCGPPEELLFLCIAVDVGERRRAEDALRASEQRFRSIVETATEAMAVADLETRQLRFVNPALCRLLGYTADELLQLKADALHAPEDRERAMALFTRVVQGEDLEVITLLARKDGSTVEVSARPARLELDGRPCLAGLFWDLTERRLTEAERLRAQKLDALSGLAGGIGHDFNNLLQGISTSLGAARLATGLAEARAAIQDAEDALQMAARLTSQLLTFARGGAPVTRLVELGPLLLRASRVAVGGSGTTCTFDLAPDLSWVQIDEAQLEQVVHNLVLNAAQAMGGRGEVRVSARNVGAAAAPDLPPAAGPLVAITVADSGSGIPAEHIPRIFDPYFTTKRFGSGLGLPTAYSVVRRHGGHLEVRSAPGQGTTFTAYLPAARAGGASTAPDQPSPAPGSTPPGRMRILWMDDEARLRLVTERLLVSLGYEVEMASDGAQAVERYLQARSAQRPFDVVVLDLTVREGMGGLEALKRLRALDPDVRTVACSGYSDDAAMAEFRAHGFSAVLRKPSTVEALEAALAAARVPRG